MSTIGDTECSYSDRAFQEAIVMARQDPVSRACLCPASFTSLISVSHVCGQTVELNRDELGAVDGSLPTGDANYSPS